MTRSDDGEPWAPYQGAPAAPVTLDTISADSFAGRAIPRRRWLVPSMIPEGTVAMLSGDGGLGKSLLALQLAVAVATSTDWIGAVPEPGLVLYLSAEDEADELHRRLADIVASRSLGLADLADLHIAPLAGLDAVLALPQAHSGPLAATPLFAALEARIAGLGPRLVILDGLADVFGGDELVRVQARAFIGLLRGLCLRHGTTVLLIAHPSVSGMASGSGISGSTAWNNSMRARLYLERPRATDDNEPDPHARVLRTVKANYAAAGAEVRLRWRDGVLRLDGPGASGLDRAVAEAGAERVFLELLARLAGQGRDVSHKPSPNYAPTVFAKEPNNGSITKRGFERAMAALFQRHAIALETSGPPSRQRTRIVAA